jgi:hypothetical protein
VGWKETPGDIERMKSMLAIAASMLSQTRK